MLFPPSPNNPDKAKEYLDITRNQIDLPSNDLLKATDADFLEHWILCHKTPSLSFFWIALLSRDHWLALDQEWAVLLFTLHAIPTLISLVQYLSIKGILISDKLRKIASTSWYVLVALTFSLDSIWIILGIAVFLIGHDVCKGITLHRLKQLRALFSPVQGH